MANRYDIIHIDFQANARGANAAIESIRKEAEESSKKIEQLKKDLEAATKGGDTYTADLIKGNLRGEEKRLQQLTQAQNELIKGMRVLDQAVKQFNDGSLQEMNAAFQKSAYNAAKLAQSKMQTGTKEWREMGAVMQETEQNYTRMQRDTDQLIEHLKNGGTVFRKTLEDEKKGLQDLLQVLPYMGVEYRKAEEQLKFLTKTTDDMLIKERQLKGEIVTTDDARRESLKLTQEGAEAARRQGEAAEKEIGWRTKVAEVLDKQRISQEQLAKQSAQEVADNIERLQEYEDVIEGAGIAIKEAQDKIKGKQDKADRLESDADIAYRQYLDLQKKRDEATKNDTQATKENTEANKENAESIKQVGDAVKQVNQQEATKNPTLEGIKQGAEEAKVSVEELEEKVERLRQESVNTKYQAGIKSDPENYMSDWVRVFEDEFNKKHPEWAGVDYRQGKMYDELKAAGITKKMRDAYKALGGRGFEYKGKGYTGEYFGSHIDLNDRIKMLKDYFGELKGEMLDFMKGSFLGGVKDTPVDEVKQKLENLKNVMSDAEYWELIPKKEQQAITFMIQNFEKLIPLMEKTQAIEKERNEAFDKEFSAWQKENTLEAYAAPKIAARKAEWDPKVAKADKEYADAQEELRLAKEQQTQTTEKETAAEDKSTESKKKKTKATKDDTKATKENTEASKEEAEQVDEVAVAKEKWKKADSAARRARNDANKAIEEGNKTIEENNALIDDTKNKQAQLEKQQEKSVATNKRNQDMLAKTTEMQQQNGEAMQQAELKKIQAQGLTMKQLETIIALYKKQHDEELEANTDAWREKGAEIERLTKILNEWKGEAKLQMMTERIGNIGNLSNAAFEETKKFWQAMSEGADKNDPKLQSIEGNLKVIAEEERKRTEVKAAKLGGDLTQMTEQDIRESIDAANQLVLAYGRGSDKAKELAQQIVNAEEHIKRYDVEAERNARKQAEAVKDMRDQLEKGTSLSDSALNAQKNFWQRLIDDPKTATEALKEYEAELTKIDIIQRVKASNERDKRAARLEGDLKLYTASEIREGIEATQQLMLNYEKGSDKAKELAQRIVDAEEHIKLYDLEAERDARRQAESIVEMRKQLELGTELSETALKAQQNYWQKLADDPKTAIEKVKEYQAEVERVKDLIKEQDIARRDERASWLSGDLTTMDEQKIRQAIEAGNQLILTYEKGSDEAKELATKIVNAEEHVRKYDVEAERAARRQQEAVEQMQKQLEQGTSLTQSALKAQQNFWQKLIDDPKTAKEKVAEYVAELERVKKITAEKTASEGEAALAFFRGSRETATDEEQRKFRNATAADVKEQADALKAYRDSLPREDKADVIAEINEYLIKTGQAAKGASEELMALDDAMKIAEQAQKNVYLNKDSTGFVATPQEIQQATKALEQQRDAIIQTIKAKRDSGAATDAEEKELQDLTNKLKALKFEQDNFNMSQAKMQELMRKPTNAVSLDELKAAIKRADGELHRMKQSLGENNKEYQDFAAQVKNAKNVLKDMEGQAKATSSAFEKAWTRLKTYVTFYVSAAAAIQKVIGTFGDLMELSDKMGEVQKTTNLSADAIGRLTNNLKKMDVRTSLVQLEEIAASAGQLGLKTEEDILGFTEAANKLMIALPEMGREAATEMMRVAIATGEVDKIKRQMEEGVISGSSATAVAMEKIASTVDRLRASSASTAPEITDFVKRMGAVGAQSGITIDQVAALGSTISSLGMRVEMSATALSRMIPAIKNNAFAIGKIIGKTETEILDKFEKGMGMDVIIDVFKAIRGNVSVTADDIINNTENLAKAADKVEEMFGGSMKEIMAELNQQGARAGIVFAGLSQNVEELEKQLGRASKAYEENTAIQKEFDRMNETTAAKWERLKNSVEEWFVGDTTQRWLGHLIDALRTLADFIGSDGPLATGFKMMIAYFVAMKLGFGAFFTGVKQGFGMMSTAVFSGVNVLATAVGTAINKLTGMTNAMRGVRAATIGARREWVKMDAAMRANVIGAVITALGWLALKLWDIHKAAKEAAAETGRFNQKVADEQRALRDLMDPLQKSNLSQEERSKLIKEINDQYGKYLGYMLSEYTSAMQLADAHALIAKRIREEAYERRIAEQERKVQEAHSTNINSAYSAISDQVREGAKSGTDVQAVTDLLKQVVDNRLDMVTLVEYNTNYIDKALAATYRKIGIDIPEYLASGKIKQVIDGSIDRLVADGKLSRENTNDIKTAVLAYAIEAKLQHDEVMEKTSGVRSDLRGIQGAIQNDLTKNLNNLVGNIANFAKQQPQQPTPSPVAQPDSTYRSPWQGGNDNQQGGSGFWRFNFGGKQEQTIQRAPIGWKPQINEKDVEEVRQFVEHQKNLRSLLQTDAKDMEQGMREIYESWKVSDEEMDRLQKIVTKHDNANGGGGGGSNPYGSYSVMDGYDKWDADALVKRKKQMLDYVKKMANGADVQAILAQDEKFIDEATRKGIKNVRDAIEWYNSERLKIQEELANRHLTNEGNWANPSKAKGRKTRMPVADSAIAELDRYYSWRKEAIEEQRAEEGMSEAEFNRRLEALEMEHLQKRSDLRKSYISEDKKFVKQFRDWWASVRELDAVEWELIEAEVKVATERDRKYIGMNAQKDLTSMNAIVVKQLKAIEDIINKERPFNGITDNLEENLTKMRILFADFDQMKAEALKRGAGKDEIDKIDAAADQERMKRLSAILGISEDAYTLTIEELMKRLGEAGMQSLVDALNADENGEEMKRAMLAQLHVTYDAVQDAIKKESSIIKKQVETMWSDVASDQTMSIKDQYETAISALGVQQDSVSRANSLIGAGAASERVADKLAIKQLQLRIAMQQHYYNLMELEGRKRIAFLREEAKLEKDKAERLKERLQQETDENKRRELTLKMEKAARNAIQASLDAEHAETSLNLAKTKEQTEQLKLQQEIVAKTEESQNRLYTALKEWGDLLASSLRDVMEASNAGNAEYYNERAKLDLTGKGGPGAGTYIVIDDAGTEDAKAHYEYLSEREALEREHEIEQQNAQAEAWKKVMDDLNAKMSEQITDWMNAQLQNHAVYENTKALKENTEKQQSQLEVISDQNGVAEYNTDATRMNTDALTALSAQLAKGITLNPANSGDTGGAAPTTQTAPPASGTPTVTTEQTTEGEQSVMFQEGVTPGVTWALTEEQLNAEQAQIDQRVQMQIDGIEKIRIAQEVSFHRIAKTESDTDKQMAKSSSSAFAKMTTAANLYGIAYQTVSNENLSVTQKFGMIGLQAVGNYAISSLTAFMAKATAEGAVNTATVLGKLWSQLGWAAAPVFAIFTGLLGAAMGAATSAVSKSKSTIAQATGASGASAGKLATGMLTYAEGNVNELTDPASLTPGRSYNVDGADGKTYRARYMGVGAKTHITNGPEFHLVGEKGREAIIDAHTTRNIQLNEPEIWGAIKTLYNGGSLSHTPTRRRRGVRAFAEGNIEDFEEMGSMGSMGDMGGMDMEAMQASLDRNSAIQEALLERLKEPIVARNIWTGPEGIPNMVNKMQKEAARHGEKYL